MEYNLGEYEFRIKKMNAIELLSLQSQYSFKTFEDAQYFFNLCLEMTEVKLNNKWIAVKTKGENVFFPAIVETDPKIVEEISKHVLEYLRSVFQNSNESND